MKSFVKAQLDKHRSFLWSDTGFLPLSKSGFSLIELMVAASVVGVLALAITSMSGTAFKAASISTSRQDLASLQMLIREQVSCPLTLGLPLNHDFSVPVPCAGPYLLQKNSPSGAVQLGANIPGDSARTQIGNYKVRASCVANQLEIMVESTRKDPITNTILPPRNLFAGAGGNGLCSQFFTGATCPTGRVVTGIANGIPVCSAAVACPSGQIQTGTTNGVPVCAPSGGCPGGQVEVGKANGVSVCQTPIACSPPYYQTGFSNGLPICEYWSGSCPAGTYYQGGLTAGYWPVCQPTLPIGSILPHCGAGTVLKNVGGSVQCVRNGIDMNDCHDVSNGGGAPSYWSYAQCPGGYRVVGGEGRCTGVGAQGFTHSSGITGNGWTVDCWRGDGGGESSTTAIARCCRYYD